MSKNRKNLVKKVINELLIPNNSFTTLELKLELRKKYPEYYWTQIFIHDSVAELVDSCKLSIIDDNGIYRTYAKVETIKEWI